MAKSTPKAEPEVGGLSRTQFEAALDAHGIKLRDEDSDSVFALATWLSDGVAALGETFPSLDPVAADAADLSIIQAGRQLRNGGLTSVALVRAVLERIGERDADYRSFYVVDADRALEAAGRADAELAAGLDRGPLHGIPVGVKDMIDVAGLATTAGSKGRRGVLAGSHAEVVDRLIAGGAIVMGKLATY